MTELYLIRHGMPDFPSGRKVCIGRTDTPLGKVGHMQAYLASLAIAPHVDQVFCSKLSRAIETASYLSPSPTVIDGLEEIDCGDWDGLDFEEIKMRWPDLYASRASDPGLLPLHAEPLADGQARFAAAIDKIVTTPFKRIAVVAHQSVIQSFICKTEHISLDEMRKIRLPYASVSHFSFDGGKYRLHTAGRQYLPELTPDICLHLLSASSTEERIIAHCKAVAEEAIRIANSLPLPLDKKNLYHAALLHDIARLGKDHARTGANWIEAVGYGELSCLIRQHHVLESTSINEAAILYLADKCICENKRVTIAERFEYSRKKCKDAAALAAHQDRYQVTLHLKETVNSLCGKEVII